MEGALREAQRGARSSRTCETGLLLLLFGPREEGGDDLENLEFLGVGAVQSQEAEEVVCDNLTGGVSVLLLG